MFIDPTSIYLRAQAQNQREARPFDEDNPKNALIICEFLEALLRLSLEKYGEGTDFEGDTPSQKLQRLLRRMCSLLVGKSQNPGEDSQEVENDDVQEALHRDLEGFSLRLYFMRTKDPKIKSRAGRQEPHLTMEEWIHASKRPVMWRLKLVQAVGKGKGKDRGQSNVSDSSSGSGAVNSGDTSGAAVSSSGGLTHQHCPECFVAANSHSTRLQRQTLLQLRSAAHKWNS